MSAQSGQHINLFDDWIRICCIIRWCNVFDVHTQISKRIVCGTKKGRLNKQNIASLVNEHDFPLTEFAFET